MLRILRKDIDRSFGHGALARAQEYIEAGMVLSADGSEEGKIRGTVAGSQLTAFEVTLTENQAGTLLISQCTCPVGNGCKHAAALALYVLEHTQFSNSLPSLEPTERLPFVLNQWLGDLEMGPADPLEIPDGAKYTVVYVLLSRQTSQAGALPVVRIYNRATLKNGGSGNITDYKAASIHNLQFPKHVNRYDRTLISDLNRNCDRVDWSKAEFRLKGKQGARLLVDVLQSGRCFWDHGDGIALKPGAPRFGSLAWSEDKAGVQTPYLYSERPGPFLPVEPPWYVDLESGEAGPLINDLDSTTFHNLLSAPPILPENAEAVRDRLQALGLQAEMLPKQSKPIVRTSPDPVPHLKLEIVMCEPSKYSYSGVPKPKLSPVPFARLTIDYDGVKVGPSDRQEIRKISSDHIKIISRNLEREERFQRELISNGWAEARFSHVIEVPQGRGTSLLMSPFRQGDLAHMAEFQKFVDKQVPRLREQGWIIDVPTNMRFVPEERVTWDVGIDSEEGADWFEFKLGVNVDGKTYELRPILEGILQQREQLAKMDYWSRKVVRAEADDDFFITLPGGVLIKLSKERLEALLEPLVEMFGPSKDWPGELKLPKYRLLDTADVAVAAGGWKSTEDLAELQSQMTDFRRIEPLGEPEGFNATLREYQREGLGWLQFLTRYDFGGILADDMGLGKTVQLLAHVQMEKLAGRLTAPCLVVAPTSTLPNWQREANRFVRDLKVLVLHGAKRKPLYDEVYKHDLILTNYALLARDAEHLGKTEFHLVVLDEAQNIKNSSTAQAKAARDIKARHRLCLSGTPLENHLDELWSLFQFLMPGFLSTPAKFRKEFRVPIEQKNDDIARTRLLRRVRPFMLRRTKAEVLKELPPKTEILESVELSESQRDLYESIRVAMDSRVRRLLAEKGLERSRIEMLDALLKLRQVCCDPRLVKLESAKTIDESAKLDRLQEMLQVLIEEGRRVLVFSQFTSMLDLIEERLEGSQSWVRLDGSTMDREAPVRSFESREVPLFLISLKAGGTGLNLVSADTVIHYDPWWNPAAENQATDRAHRIGQLNPVTVYKLVAVGTVEEKIVELQQRKGALAASILSGAEQGPVALSPADFTWLFER
jgi:superfamily II DNA or RNA helicase